MGDCKDPGSLGLKRKGAAKGEYNTCKDS